MVVGWKPGWSTELRKWEKCGGGVGYSFKAFDCGEEEALTSDWRAKRHPRYEFVLRWRHLCLRVEWRSTVQLKLMVMEKKKQGIIHRISFLSGWEGIEFLMGHLYPLEDTWQYLETFLSFQLEGDSTLLTSRG